MTAASTFGGLPGGWLSPRKTLLLVGNLPVMSALWTTQYADRAACDHGPVCLVREAPDALHLELFRGGSRLPAIRAQASCSEVLRAIAPIVAQWLIVPNQSDPVQIPHGTDDIVILTGADQAAIVAAYRLVKGAHEDSARLTGTRPQISVAVLGADAAGTAHVAKAIGDAAREALGITVPVRGGLQRVAPAQSSFLGTFHETAPSLARIDALLTEATNGGTRAATPAIVESLPFEPSGRFAPRAERRAPAAAASMAPLSSADAIPFRADLPPRGGRGMEPVRTPPSAAPARADSSMPPLDDAGREALHREVLSQASKTIREAAVEVQRAVAPNFVASAVNGPSVAPAVARLVEGALPESLVSFVDGIGRIDHVAPRCERIEFAIDANGSLQLVCRIDDLRMLERAQTWLRENAALFRKAYPEITRVDGPAVHIFVQEQRDFAPITGATVRLLRHLEFAGRRCYDAQTLVD